MTEVPVRAVDALVPQQGVGAPLLPRGYALTLDGGPAGLLDTMPVLPVLAYAHDTLEPLAVVALPPHEDAAPMLLWGNGAFGDLFGYGRDEVAGVDLDHLQSTETLASGSASWGEQVGFDVSARVERRCTLSRRDGSRFPARVATLPVGGVDSPLWALTIREEAEALRAGEHLRASEERFRALADEAPVGIFASEVGLRLAYVNSRFADVFAGAPTDLVGVGWLSRIHQDDLPAAMDAVEGVLRGQPADLRLRVGDETQTSWVQLRVVPTRTPTGAAGFVGTVEDVTERLQWEQTLRHQAMHDPLTGLPNRSSLLVTVGAALEGGARGEGRLALLFFDLDNFKLVNDSLGHDAGDELLCAVADRLTDALRDGDVVTRFGGDEFVVVCRGVSSDHDALALADRLLAALARPMRIAGVDASVTASVGVVLVDDRQATADTLLRDADVAMYQAKNAGRNCAALFDRAARQNQRDRLRLLADLRRALVDDALHLAFQPVVDIATGLVSGVEALLRWNHPERGAIPPSRFVPLAEESGLIGPLGDLVLRQACRQARAWELALGPAAPPTVAVNVSALQLHQPSLVQTVKRTLDEHGVPGTHLCVELTESAIMEDPSAARRALHALRDLGVRTAIDDFGTGYSSLAYLRRLPVDHLKIDKSFISGAGADGDDAIVGAVVGLARNLGLSAIAEGIETAAHHEWLRGLGCELGQGYYFSPPVEEPAATALLRAAHGRGLPHPVDVT